MENSAQCLLQEKKAAVAGEFHNIFARVTVRCTKDKGNCFIDRPVLIENPAEMCAVAL